MSLPKITYEMAYILKSNLLNLLNLKVVNSFTSVSYAVEILEIMYDLIILWFYQIPL